MILHTDNLEGRLFPWPDADDALVGGMARTVQFLRTDGKDALVLDAGDAIGPALLSRYDHGRTMIQLMNRAGYAGQVLGNHELVVGPDSLRARAGEAAFPLLAANLKSKEGGDLIFPAYAITERRGLRLGVVGLLSPELAQRVHPQELTGLKIDRPAGALRNALKGLQGQVDFRIAIVHMNYDEVLALARQFPDVDLFVAGGYGSAAVDEFIHAVQLANGNYVVSTPGSSHVGRFEVTMERGEEGWRPRGVQASLAQVDASTAEDDTARVWIESHQERFHASRGEVIGTLDEEREDGAQFVAELMQAGTGAEAAMINRGTLRPLSLRGEVRMSSLDSLMRFERRYRPGSDEG